MLRPLLLDWFTRSQRSLPWRHTHDPYAIWVSEVMLQQTRVAVVLDRYREFLERFPTVQSLARATEAEVLTVWSGLGYYRRARMLHRGAQQVCAEHGGQLPGTFAALLALPGIGPYTASAIASIAFGEPVAAVDGNVERVVLRLVGADAGQGTVLRRVQACADQLLDPDSPGNWNQAMMELGATVCLPRAPHCEACPWIAACATRGEHLTVKRPPMRSVAVAYHWTVRGAGDRQNLLLVQRDQEQTVMAGMWELPEAADHAHDPAQPLLRLRHAIMQMNYEVAIYPGEATLRLPSKRTFRWVTQKQAQALPLTGLARKVMQRLGWLPARKSLVAAPKIKAQKM